METISSSGLREEPNLESLFVNFVYFIFAFIGAMLCGNLWVYGTFEIGSSLRLSLTSLIYKKLNTVALSSLQEISLGKVINLLANDVNDIDNGIMFVTPLVTAPYSLLLSLSILWSYFGAYSLISMFLQTTILLSAGYFSKLSEQPRSEKNEVADQRIKYTNEFIENIRLIKLYAWEKTLKKVIEKLRDSEVLGFKKLAKIDSFSMMLTESCTYICVLVTCIVYVLSGGILSAEKVYTSILILNFSRYWVNYCAHKGLMFVINIKLMNKRLEEILQIKDILQLHKEGNKDQGSLLQEDLAVSFKDYTAYWSQKAEKPCLKNINVSIKNNQLIALIGKIGSGKTTFLLSFLREIPVTSGQLLFKGTISYVEQEPVIFSGSIQDNILFGNEFDSMFYAQVLRACNLTEDLQQFDHGDQTIVGERGVTMSGGQKARLSLARALYARSDIYLLDDPLSAVDSRVGKIIFERAIKQLLKDKTVILVTHHLDYAKQADKVVVMKEGSVEAQGIFEDLAKMDLDLLDIFKKREQEKKDEDGVGEREKQIIRAASSIKNSSSMRPEKRSGSFVEENVMLNEEKQEISQEESIVTTKKTYLKYLEESENYKLAFFALGCYFSAQLFILFFTKLIGYWAQIQNEAHYNGEQQLKSDGYYIGLTISLAAAIMGLNFLKVLTSQKFLLESNTKLHAKMLYKISRTFIAFFDSTPIGNILNRFSNDLGVLDKANFNSVYDVFDMTCAIIILLCYICYMNPFLTVPCVIVILILLKFKVFFTKPTVELRRVDLISRSPIYSEISSTLNGLLAIRVYNQGPRFIRNFLDVIYTSSKTFLMYIRNNRLFAMTMDGLVYILIICSVSSFIYLAYLARIEVGAFGLALFYLVSIANDTSWAIRQLIFMDINMQSAERIQQYCQLPEEAPTKVGSTDAKLGKSWPVRGDMSLQNVYLKYPSTKVHALNGLTLNIEAGSKVGIVGRTGAGKSSIIQALFRIVEIDDLPNSFIKIDGVDIRTVGLETLRQGLSILPQTPVIFTGTIRRNLDPFGQFSSYELWKALEQVSLKSYVESLDKGLDTDMSLSSSVFSAGQKQLICMARVILKKSKVVILDEATANVDMSTDNFIQEKINEIFKDCVVITIAHRLSTIAHYDKVLVLHQGRMVEYDHPYKLLVAKIGDTKVTKDKGSFVEMVRKSGEKTVQEAFEKAYAAYYSKGS